MRQHDLANITMQSKKEIYGNQQGHVSRASGSANNNQSFMSNQGLSQSLNASLSSRDRAIAPRNHQQLDMQRIEKRGSNLLPNLGGYERFGKPLVGTQKLKVYSKHYN